MVHDELLISSNTHGIRYSFQGQHPIDSCHICLTKAVALETAIEDLRRITVLATLATISQHGIKVSHLASVRGDNDCLDVLATRQTGQLDRVILDGRWIADFLLPLENSRRSSCTADSNANEVHANSSMTDEDIEADEPIFNPRRCDLPAAPFVFLTLPPSRHIWRCSELRVGERHEVDGTIVG